MRTLTEENSAGSLLDEALGRWMPLFENPATAINGGDAIEWLGDWLPRVQALRNALARSTKQAREDQIVSDALVIVERRCRKTGVSLNNPAAAKAFMTLELRPLSYETFNVLFLDNRHRLIAREEMFRGTIDGAQCIRGRFWCVRCTTTHLRSCLPTSTQAAIQLRHRPTRL